MPSLPPSGNPQDLGSFLHWIICLRSAYGGLAVSLSAPVPLLSSDLSALLPESDFLCPVATCPPMCLSASLALSLWASVSVPNLFVDVPGCVHLSICICPGAYMSLSLSTVSESFSSYCSAACLSLPHTPRVFLPLLVFCPCAISSACLSLFEIISFPISVSLLPFIPFCCVSDLSQFPLSVFSFLDVCLFP